MSGMIRPAKKGRLEKKARMATTIEKYLKLISPANIRTSTQITWLTIKACAKIGVQMK
jgi:hypothetical protein